jgi:hypothetical protein
LPVASSEALSAIINAEREITRVLHLYCHAVDRHDMVELRSVYHPGAATNTAPIQGC